MLNKSEYILKLSINTFISHSKKKLAKHPFSVNTVNWSIQIFDMFNFWPPLRQLTLSKSMQYQDKYQILCENMRLNKLTISGEYRSSKSNILKAIFTQEHF